MDYKYSSNRPENSFWKRREFFCKVYQKNLEEDKLESFLDNANFSFELKEKDPFEYKMLLVEKKKSYNIPLIKNCKASYEFDDHSKIVKFFIEIDDELELVPEFTEEGLEEAGYFRNILCRLMFQTNTRKCSSNVNENEYYSLLPRKNLPVFSEEMNKALESLKKSKNNFLFLEIGSLSKLEKTDKEDKPELLLPEGIFVVEEMKDFVYFLKVFNKNLQCVYKTDINSHLNYMSDSAKQNLIWTDKTLGKIVLYSFNFKEDILNHLNIVIGTLCIQNTHKNSIQNIIKENQKNNISDFYLGDPNEGITDNDAEEIDQYKQDYNKYEFGDSSIMNFQNITPLSKIIGFTELKTKNMGFVSRENEINIVKLNNDKTSFNHINNLKIKKNSELFLNPNKIMMMKNDEKMLIKDENDSNHIYYGDVETEKIITTFETKKEKINDIALTDGKQSVFGNCNTFFTTGKNDINKFDVREPNSINNRYYKSPYDFSHIYSVNKDKFFIGNKKGELRLYNDFHSSVNAKNLIPSLYGDNIVYMDSTKDGKFLLLTFTEYILFFRTFQNNISSFDHTYKKDSKPKTIMLKIHPDVLRTHNVLQLNFQSAKFNENDKESESLIIATSGDLIVIWKLKDVLNGNYLSKNATKLNEKIIDGEFLYNSNNIVTAFANDFSIKKLNKKNLI